MDSKLEKQNLGEEDKFQIETKDLIGETETFRVTKKVLLKDLADQYKIRWGYSKCTRVIFNFSGKI